MTINSEDMMFGGPGAPLPDISETWYPQHENIYGYLSDFDGLFDQHNSMGYELMENILSYERWQKTLDLSWNDAPVRMYFPDIQTNWDL